MVAGACLPHFQMLLRAEDAGQRAGAAATISRMGSHAAAAVPDLIEAVKDESAEVRTQAALALWASGVKEPALLTTLQALLHDGEERVRLVAAGALADYRAATPAEVLPVLMAGLMHPEDQFAGDIAAGRLGWLGLEAVPAAPALRAALFEPAPLQGRPRCSGQHWRSRPAHPGRPADPSGSIVPMHGRDSARPAPPRSSLCPGRSGGVNGGGGRASLASGLRR